MGKHQTRGSGYIDLGRHRSTIPEISRRAPPLSVCNPSTPARRGRIENSQVAVYVTSAAARRHALIDGTLYLPKSWTCGTHPGQAVPGFPMMSSSQPNPVGAGRLSP